MWGRGLCTTPEQIHHGKNSGFQAINLAYHFGVARIVMLGYDLQHTGGQTHWHGDHPPSLTNAHGIEGWRADFRPLAKDLRAEGVQVYNCSPTTALDCFDRCPIEHLD